MSEKEQIIENTEVRQQILDLIDGLNNDKIINLIKYYLSISDCVFENDNIHYKYSFRGEGFILNLNFDSLEFGFNIVTLLQIYGSNNLGITLRIYSEEVSFSFLKPILEELIENWINTGVGYSFIRQVNDMIEKYFIYTQEGEEENG